MKMSNDFVGSLYVLTLITILLIWNDMGYI
jgi:hypothetical protein